MKTGLIKSVLVKYAERNVKSIQRLIRMKHKIKISLSALKVRISRVKE